MTDRGDRDLQTLLRPGRDHVEFVVATGDPLCQDRLIKMGWQPEGAGVFRRRLSNSGDVARIFANFDAHIEEMILQSAGLRPVRWQEALAEFVDRVAGPFADRGLRWWLYGSGALAVRGLDVEPGDLDLAVDDPWLAGELLADRLVEPVTRMQGWVADSGGRAFCGAIVEWLSGAHPTGAVPPHEQEPAAASHLELVSWRGRSVPVPSWGCSWPWPSAGAWRRAPS